MFDARITMYLQKPCKEETVKLVEEFLLSKVSPIKDSKIVEALQALRNKVTLYDPTDPVSMAFKKQICVVLAFYYETVASPEDLQNTETYIKTVLSV